MLLNGEASYEGVAAAIKKLPHFSKICTGKLTVSHASGQRETETYDCFLSLHISYSFCWRRCCSSDILGRCEEQMVPSRQYKDVLFIMRLEGVRKSRNESSEEPCPSELSYYSHAQAQ